MDYPEDNRPSDAKQPYEPGARFVAMLDEMTRQSYACLAEADLMRRVAHIERRLGKLEHALSMREQ